MDFVIHLDSDRGADRRRRRYVTSVREVLDADGSILASNEIFRPGPDRRAVPGVPMRASTLEDLVDAGLDEALLHGSGRQWS